MRISVLIPAYNASPFLEATLRSVASGLGAEDEIIVVDDHSQDRTIDLARKVLNHFPCQSQVVLNEGKGACRARNQALMQASGHWIQWLDADDLIPSTKWDHVLPLSENRALVGCPWRPFHDHVPDGVYDDGRNWSIHNDHSPADWLAADRMMIPAAWFGERDLFQATSGWDESLQVNQDGEYFARVIQQASRVHFTGATEVYYRRGLGESTSTFTPEKADSLFRSTESMVRTALHLEDSERMQQMAANRWQHFIYTTYPNRPDLIQRAQRKLRDLPKADLNNPLTVSFISQMIAAIVGWRALVKLRLWRNQCMHG